MTSKTKSGFTLIELLVVIAIIGILAGMVLVSMSGARSKARDARRISDMRQLISAQEMYYGDFDAYATNAGATVPTSIGTYLPATPVDPNSGAQYSAIINTADPSKFCYWAVLENGNKTQNGCTTAAPCTIYTASYGGNFYKAAAPAGATDALKLVNCTLQP